MAKKILLFAPSVMDLAETTRLIGIAKAVMHHAAASAVITGSYLTIQVTCRILRFPLVWVIRSP